MSEQPLRLGIVGCGGISHQHAATAAAIPDQARFVACCDVHEPAAREWSARYGQNNIAVYTDYLKMAAEQSLDAVLLATWPVQHHEQIEKLLAAGVKNILCEKALTLTGRQAMEILHLVRDARAFLMEGFMFRHHPATRRMAQIIASGQLGEIDSLRAVFNATMTATENPGDPKLNWRFRPECGGGVPYDFTCYCVNAVNHYAGERPTRVRALGSVSARFGTLDRLRGMIQYASGKVAFVESSHHAAQSQETQINGAKMALYLPVSWAVTAPMNLELRRNHIWGAVTAETEIVTVTDPYRLQLENFTAVVRGRARPAVPLVESVVNTFTIEALVRSATENRDVDIDLPSELKSLQEI